jgi:hypothetical protein|tara:strand:- start:1144 stop:1323 length:180 start_codon:yes stop_codon:yes gene_type:complete
VGRGRNKVLATNNASLLKRAIDAKSRAKLLSIIHPMRRVYDRHAGTVAQEPQLAFSRLC